MRINKNIFFYSPPKEVLQVSKKQSCLDQYLVKWTQLMALNDAIIKKIPPSTTENRFYPFSGKINYIYSKTFFTTVKI